MDALDTAPTDVGAPNPKNPQPAPQPAIDPRVQQITSMSQAAANTPGVVQQVWQTLNARAPAPAPLHDANTGSSVSPILQAGDAAMRTAGQVIADGANAVGSAAAHSFGTDVAPQFTGPGGRTANVAGKAMDAVGSTLFPNDYMRERTPDLPKMDPFAYRDAPIVQPPAPATPASAPAKADTPPAAGPTKENGYAIPELRQKTPDANTQNLIAAQNANRTPVSNPYAGPAASGMPAPQGGTEGSIGVAGFQKQLQNIQALSASTPQGGFNSLPDYAAIQNAEMDKRAILNIPGLSVPQKAMLAIQLAGQNSHENIAAMQASSQQSIAQGNNLAHLQGIGLQGQNQLAAAQLQGQNHLQGIGLQNASQQQITGMNNATHLQVAGLNNAQQDKALAETIRAHDMTDRHQMGVLAETKANNAARNALLEQQVQAHAKMPASMQPISVPGGMYITNDNSVVDQSPMFERLSKAQQDRKKAAR